MLCPSKLPEVAFSIFMYFYVRKSSFESAQYTLSLMMYRKWKRAKLTTTALRREKIIFYPLMKNATCTLRSRNIFSRLLWCDTEKEWYWTLEEVGHRKKIFFNVSAVKRSIFLLDILHLFVLNICCYIWSRKIESKLAVSNNE